MQKKILTFKKFLNENAELGWHEEKTTRYILSALPVKPLKVGFGGTNNGVLYKIGNGKNAILIRADMDALRAGDKIKHICGHSSHMAAGMGALFEAKNIESKLFHENKSVYFLFQPAEETFPSGAKTFLDECSHEISSVRYAFGIHMWPKLPRNIIGLKKGSLMARGDYIRITIRGKMVHIKDAPSGVDSLEAVAKIILAVKKIQKQFNQDIRINIGLVRGGLQPNTVADLAQMEGDIRMKDEKYQKIIQNELTQAINSIDQDVKTKTTLEYFPGCPVLANNTGLQKEISQYLETQSFTVSAKDPPFSYGCEDFSFISYKIPSLYAFIGSGDPYDIHELSCTISDEATITAYKYFQTIINWWLKHKNT